MKNETQKPLPGWIDSDTNCSMDCDEAWDIMRKLIKVRMKEMGFTTLESVAQECDMHRGALSRILNNQRDIQFSTLWRLIKALGWNDLPSVLELPDPLPENWNEL